MGPESEQTVAKGNILDDHLQDRGEDPDLDRKQVIIQAQLPVTGLNIPQLPSKEPHDAEGLDGIHVIETFGLECHHFTGYFPHSFAVFPLSADQEAGHEQHDGRA